MLETPRRAGQTVDRIADPWGERTPYGGEAVSWPVRVDQHLAPGVDESDVDR